MPPLLPDGAGYRLAAAREADRSQRAQIERRLRRKERRVARLERLAARGVQVATWIFCGAGVYVAGTMLHQWLLGRVLLGLDTIPILLALPGVGSTIRIVARLSLVMHLGAVVLLAAAALERRRWKRETQALGWAPERLATKPEADEPGTGW